MSSIEQTGKSIEEATQLALEQLGVTEDEVDVEILEEGTKGFLGLKQAPARVRVTLREAPVSAAPESHTAEEKPRRQRSRVEKKTEAPPEQIEPQPPLEEAVPVEMSEPAEEAPEIDMQQAAELSRRTLQKVLDGIGCGGKATIKNVVDDRIDLDIVGGESAVLIGKHGQTLNAVQYLVGIVTNKSLAAHKIRLVIDVEGYRKRREDELVKQALYYASKVKQTNQEAVLPPVSANDRRVIHMALADDPDVCTYSEGEDPVRCVVISPKK